MAKPVLIINNHDYTEYIIELSVTRNDLDADGSGRDVQTGLMIRKYIATKIKIEVKFDRLSEAMVSQITSDITPTNPPFYQATFLNPATNERETKTFYTSSVPFGAQRYNEDGTYYDGFNFSMTER